MAFDGITIAAMVQELHKNLDNGRFNKIAQPEADALMITGKGANGQCRLFISASPSLPLIYFTGKNKPSPLTAPNFCMLLRKHLGSARIGNIVQPGLERVVEFELEHLNELGDPCKKYLIVELMGKYSNIIFCDENRMILDSIRHVSSHMSSVREVLPGRDYFLPQTQEKHDPLTITEEAFKESVCKKPCNIAKAIYTTLTGISPLIAEEICYRASIDGSDSAQSLDENEATHLYYTFHRLIEQVQEEDFTPSIIYRDDEPVEYAVLPLTQYGPEYHCQTFESVSEMLETYYALTEQSADTESEIEHLESVSNALDIARAESDLSQIKEELTEYGYIKKHYTNKKGQKAQTKSKPFHYISSDGFDIFVGKNNYQNDELTFKMSTGNDWWFHAKKMAGSHVVVKTPDGELPDRTFEEAGRLAAYYSKGRTAPKVEIDYIQKKHVKKPGGAKPGFVVYYTNYSLMAAPDISDIKEAPQS